MPVMFYSSIGELSSLSKEPYASFTKKYKSLKGFDGQEIEIRIDNGKEGFCEGFFTDDCYMENANLRFVFSTMNNAVDSKDKAYFIRMVCSFSCNDDNFRYYQRHICLLKKRVAYFFMPKVSCLEFSSLLDDNFNLQFDVLVKEREDVLTVCYSLMNQVITLFSFED